MKPIEAHDITQVGAPTDLLSGGVANSLLFRRAVPAWQSGKSGCHLVELLRQVAPLSSEEPEEMLRLFVRVGEICDLGITDDRQFVIRGPPLVSGRALKLLGSCLRGGCSWA